MASPRFDAEPIATCTHIPALLVTIPRRSFSFERLPAVPRRIDAELCRPPPNAGTRARTTTRPRWFRRRLLQWRCGSICPAPWTTEANSICWLLPWNKNSPRSFVKKDLRCRHVHIHLYTATHHHLRTFC